jgi:sporulation protein YlmC with PRC-barrel domain
MEEHMLKTHLAASLAATVLMAGTALAQTTAPTQPAGSGQVMTQMPQDLMRGSQLMGIDVYGADNQKIGDIDEVLVDRQGKIHGLVVGVGGFLGIGQKDVAIPFDQIQWMSNQEVQASSNRNQGGESGTNTAGGVTVPSTATGGASQPATTGSTAAGGTGGMTGGTAPAGNTAGGGATAGSGSDPNTPARAMVKMTKADLQNAPEFRYSANDPNRAGAAGNTNPPPQNVNTPGNTPANAPRQ